MSFDPIESIALIPNPSANFDELWMIVNRDGGRYVEKMVKRLQETSCGDPNVLADELVFTDSTVDYEFGNSIATTIGTGIGVLYVVTDPGHGYSNGDIVRIRNSNVTAIANKNFVIGQVTTNTYALISEVT